MPALVSIVGFAAAALSALIFLPQVVQTWRSKSARDVSVGTLTISALCMVLWLMYGAYTRSPPILLANALNLFFTLTLAFLKWRFRNAPVA